MAGWRVEFTNEFGRWWDDLDEAGQASVDAHVTLLMEHGPTLPHPYSSKVRESRHTHMRELRVQHAGRPIRIFYAFDPRGVAVLLIGGDKTGDDRFYQRMVPLADRLYEEHLGEIGAD